MAAANVSFRPGNAEDAGACGQIIHDAFAAINEKHNFPKDISSPEMGSGMASGMLSHPGFYSVIAESEGKVVGSNFMDERSTIFGVGPITVAPDAQDSSIGRQLMQNVLSEAGQRQAVGVRLLQDAFHFRSFALYTKLGFEMRATTSVMQGAGVKLDFRGHVVRPASEGDLDACNQVCLAVHGHDRAGELRDAIT